ncbi:MAG: 2-amino-4-hydroxy-6-hydroxymethyldihydropteridine diphosphokinase [Methylococcales bacterium]
MTVDYTNIRGALVYIGLGSNLCNPVEQIRSGVAAVAGLPGCGALARSGLYASPPMGPKDQPDYVNAVMAIDSLLSPASLLDRLQAIEASQGRIRHGLRWGPRTLDLDILLYNQEIVETENLIVPHSGIADRAFVLYPLAEIAPDLVIPGKGSIADLLRRYPADGLSRID